MENNNWERHWIDLAKKQVLINNYYYVIDDFYFQFFFFLFRANSSIARRSLAVLPAHRQSLPFFAP